MITVTDLVLRVAARTLLESASFTIARGDRVGLVGRNGAGKTTLARTLAGEAQPDGGRIVQSGQVGYLPQGPSESDPRILTRDRILSGRGLDTVRRDLQLAQEAMAGSGGHDPATLRRYGHLEDRFQAMGGYAA